MQRLDIDEIVGGVHAPMRFRQTTEHVRESHALIQICIWYLNGHQREGFSE